MAPLRGTISERDWSVSVDVRPHGAGFDCVIHLSHDGPEGKFEHQFKHHEVLPTEREAVIAGLREGMLWLEQKISKTISL